MSSIIGDFMGALGDAVTGSSPPQSAPVPSVKGLQLPKTSDATWRAPEANGSGQFSVHRDALESVAKGMLSDLTDLDNAISKVRSSSGAFSTLRGWTTGQAFAENGESTCHGFAQVGTQTGVVQSTTSKGLSDTAAAYEEAETTNRQAIGQVGSQLDASGGSVSAAGGI
ncbi:MAG TPA: hypothetical protein VK817_08485 [Trebonia sp.]|jgi:hypothetical protein|nr:hypothetical protein [Trebonia sp.]